MSDTDRADTDKRHLTLRPDAGRFEFGYPNVSGIYALGLVAEQYLSFGAENIRAYVLGLLDALRDGIECAHGVEFAGDFPAARRSAIAVLRFGQECRLSQEALDAAGITAQIHDRPDGTRSMRVSVHYYNDLSDMEKLIYILNKKGD